MDDSFIKALQAAKNPEDKAALIAETSLSMFSDEIARVTRQCVLFHWFDQSIVEALLQTLLPDAERAQDIYRHIASLPFVEQLAWGVAYQDLTRQGLLKHYAHTQPELLKSAARVAAPLYRASTENKRNAAEALFCSVISGDPASKLYLNTLLEQAMNQQDWQHMEGLFRLQEEAEQLPFVESIPRTEHYWMLRSIVDRVQGRPKAALTDYDRVLTINPQNALAYLNRSIVHTQQMDYRQAWADYHKALRLDPALVQTYVDNRILSPQPMNLVGEESIADAQEHIGQSVGNYRLLRLLGEGTFGTVYLAEHADDHSYAAVKLFHIPLTGRNALRAFLNEARTVRLRHPHIVPILDFGLNRDNLPYLVMTYADGGSLRDRHPKGSKPSLETIDTYVQQLASALQYAHDRRIIHRDVKPENMLLSSRDGARPHPGKVQLSDFGIAKISELASISSQHTIVGTPAYAAPEQSQGQPRFASDQYALAVVVYEWLADQRPFQGDPFAVTLHHRMDAPPSLRSIRPEVSPQIEQVVFKALAKAPQDRFPTITHFAQALHAALQEDIEATQPLPHPDKNRVQSAPRITRRTILVGLVTLGGIGAAVTWFARTQTQKAHLGNLLYTYHGHPATVTGVTWSPDGKRIASTSDDYTVQVWDAFTGDHVVTHSGHTAGVNRAVWSPDGKRIASASYDGTVQVWNATTGGSFFTCNGHLGGVSTVEWSPNGKYLASSSADGSVQIWEAATGNRLFTYRGNAGWVYTVAWSPDSTLIASGTNHGIVQVWVATTGKVVLSYPGHGTSLVHHSAWSPQGSHIASGGDDMTVQVWDATTGNTSYTYRGHTKRVYDVEWSPDGKRIASASADRTVQIWDAFNGDHAFFYRGHSGYVQGVAWSPDGQHIASASSDTTAQVWQAT